MSHTRRTARLCLVAAAAALALAVPSPALATITDATGVDQWLDATGTTPGSYDVLAVSGDPSDLVYLDVYKDGAPVASHLTYYLGDYAESPDQQDLMAVLGITSEGFEPQADYAVRAYTNREDPEGSAIYAGSLRTVWGQFGDKLYPITVRSVADGTDPAYLPHQTYDLSGVTWVLSSDDAIDDPEGQGREVYAYALPSETATTVKGRVTYLDVTTQEAIQVDEYDLSLNGTGVSVPVESLLSANGKVWRTLWLRDTVSLAYPGTTDVTIACKEFVAAPGASGVPYKAKIHYVDTAGNALSPQGLTDTLYVNKDYAYTPPTRIYLQDPADANLVRGFELVDKSMVLAFSLANPTPEVSVVYRQLTDDDQSIWTIQLINGLQGVPAAEKTIATINCTWSRDGGVAWTLDGATVDVDALPFESVQISEDGRTVSFVPKDTTALNGTSYDLGASLVREHSHTFSAASMDDVLTLYYIPSDKNGSLEPYQITINYVNIANGEVITSYQRTSTPDSREDLAIEGIPERFEANGVEWVRLNGQTDTLYHSYYSPDRAYSVWYRDVNDDLHAATVITSIRTVYDTVTQTVVVPPTETGTTATTGTGTATTGTGTATTGTSTTGEAAAGEGAAGTTGNATLGGDGGNVAVVSDNDSSSVVNSEGTELGTVRIEDDSTPLAGPDGGTTGEGADSATNPGGTTALGKAGNGVLAGVVAAIVAVLALVASILWKRDKKDDQDQTPYDGMSR